MQEPHTAISAGQHVVVRDERWTVVHTETFDSIRLLQLRGIDRDNRDEVQSILTPFDTVAPAGRSSSLRRRSRRRVLAAAARAATEALPWDVCWTAARARIDLHDWQMAPAAAAVTGTPRILLADGVGLGKTVQAALVIAELIARGLADRVLILTPAAIREQWANELSDRFGLRAVVFDHASLAAAAATLPADVNPWQTTPLIVSSIDLVKRPEVRVAVDAVTFDVLVVDEAHHLTRGSDRGAVVADLAARTPWLVLATATPHGGDDQSYEFLLGLGGAVDAQPTAVFRRTLRVGSASRRTRLLLVTPTAAERELLAETWRYARALARTRTDGARLAGGIIARRAASSAAAAARTVARRLAFLTRQSAPVREQVLPWDDLDTIDDDVTDDALAGPGLPDAAAEIDWLRHLLDLATAASAEWSKRRVVLRLLARTQETLLVFSEYRDVVRQLATSLEATTSAAMLHGGMSPRERKRSIEAFHDGRARVLVATDAAGEGLNLHHHCRTVVNLELPWTPLRHEQRVGRVDRIGQTRTVHAIDLAHRGSYEELVIARLERRRQRAAHALHEQTRRSHSAAPRGEEARVARRLARLSQHCDGGGGAVYSAGWPRRMRDVHRYSTFLVFSLPMLTPSGRLVSRELVIARVVTRRRFSRAVLRSLLHHPQLIAVLAAESDRRVTAIRSGFVSIARSLTDRIGALLVHLDRQAGHMLWQGSLFDRRREQQASRHASSVAAFRDHLSRRLIAVQELQQVRAGEPQLVAAWQGEASCCPASAER
jgi:superfamily II DNA or RNA helicase